MARILIAENDRQLRRRISVLLQESGYEIVEADNIGSATSIFKKSYFDLVIANIELPAEVDGFNFIKKAKSVSRHTMIIMIGSDKLQASLMRAIKIGAEDYLRGDFTDSEILWKIQKYLKEKQFRKSNHKLNREVVRLQRDMNHEFGFKNMVGESRQLHEIKKTVRMCADRPESVFITGERGVGKEMIARAIHFSSYRKKKPFITVNCGNLPKKLMEEELFGVEKDDSSEGDLKSGRFDLAINGTLFLDEVQRLPQPIQTKVLHYIETGEFDRAKGSNSVRADIRVIASSTENLDDLLKSDKILPGLLQYLTAIHINIPPLRDRKKDIPVLINHFLLKYRHDLNVRIAKVTAPTVHYLMNYDWPGNVRELDKALKRSVVTCKTSLLRIENVDWLYFREEDQEKVIPQVPVDKPEPVQKKPGKSAESLDTLAIPEFLIEDMENVYDIFITNQEKALFEQILVRCQGNVRKAARQLSISRTTLRTKLEKYSLNDMTRRRTTKPEKIVKPKRQIVKRDDSIAAPIKIKSNKSTNKNTSSKRTKRTPGKKDFNKSNKPNKYSQGQGRGQGRGRGRPNQR